MRRVCGISIIAVIVGLALAAPAQAGAAPVQTITVVNGAHVAPRMVDRLERALVTQVNRDVGPVWHTPHIAFGSGGLQLILTNGKRPDGLGGFHAASQGIPPFAVVYVKANGDSWTILASHELIEMLIDPTDGRYINGQLAEVSDPVYFVYYTINGVQVSDFVIPAWFRQGSRGPWDFERFLGL